MTTRGLRGALPWLLLAAACRATPTAEQRLADSLLAAVRDSLGAGATESGWRTTDSIAALRLEGSTATIGSRTYLIGGFGADRALTPILTVEVFDHETGRWGQAAPLPTPVTHMQAAVIGDTAIWIAGGFVGSHPAPPTAEVWRYDVRADRWVAGPPLPAPRGSGALVALGDTLYFVGGWEADRATDRRELWRLLPRASTWQARRPIPVGRGHAAAVGHDGGIVVLGGQRSHDLSPVDLTDAWRYDPARDRWSPIAALPMTRSHVETAVTSWGDWLLLPGGGDVGSGRRYIADLLGYDTRRTRWRRLPDLPVPLRGAHGWIWRDTLHMAGGSERDNLPTNWPHWRLPLRGTWHQLPGEGPVLREPRVGVLGDALLLFSAASRATSRYDLAAGAWSPETALPMRPRPGAVAAVASDGRDLLVAGGGPVIGSGVMLQRFDGTARQWPPGVLLPSSVTRPLLHLIDGTAWLADGGGRGAWRQRADGGWDSLRTAAPPGAWVASADDGRTICLFGRADADSASVRCLDTVTAQWRIDAFAQAPIPIDDGAQAVHLEGRFHLLAGGRLVSYDPVANRWTAGIDLPLGVDGAMGVDGDRLLVYQGATGRLWMLWP